MSAALPSANAGPTATESFHAFGLHRRLCASAARRASASAASSADSTTQKLERRVVGLIVPKSRQATAAAVNAALRPAAGAGSRTGASRQYRRSCSRSARGSRRHAGRERERQRAVVVGAKRPDARGVVARDHRGPRMAEAIAIARRVDGDRGRHGGDERRRGRREAPVVRHEQHVGLQRIRIAAHEIELAARLEVAR